MTMADLISRDAALKAVNAYDYRDFTVEQVKTITDGCAEELRKLPAIDAEPVRHGTWEMRRKTINTDFATLTGTYPTCNLCGHVEYGVDKSTPYCPGCGAKMDGDDT